MGTAGRGARKGMGRLELEQLEERIAPAGNITVLVISGSLVVTGDDLGNDFEINQAGLGVGEFRVVSGGDHTDINGLPDAYIACGITRDLKITLNGGNDTVLVSDVNIPGNISITTLDGHNSVQVLGGSTVGGSVTVKGGAGDDALTLNAMVGRNVTFDAGNGDNALTLLGPVYGNVTFKNAETVGTVTAYVFGSVGGRLAISSAGGDTDIEAQGLIGRGLQIKALDGDHDISIHDEVITGGIKINLGNGDALTRIENCAVTGAVTLAAKAGNATVQIVDTDVNGGVNVNHAGGTNILSVMRGEITGNVSAKNGAGPDTRHVNGATIGGFRASNGDGDVVTIFFDADVGLRGINIRNGSGEDVLAIENTMVHGAVSVNNGAGNSATYVTGSAIGYNGPDGPVKSMRIKNGEGFDIFSAALSSSFWKDLAIDNGYSGSQTAIDTSYVYGNLKIAAKDGAETVIFESMEVGGTTTISAGDGGSDIRIDDSGFLGAVNVKAGAGNDLFRIETVAPVDGATSLFMGRVTLATGEGDDIVQIGVAADATRSADFRQAVLIDGGDDSDTLDMDGNGNVFAVLPAVKNIETRT